MLIPVTLTLSTFPAANCLGLNPVPRRGKPARPTTGAPLCLKSVLAERRERYERDRERKEGVKDEAAKEISVEIQLVFLPVKINCLNITLTAT